MVGAFNNGCRRRFCGPVPRYPEQDYGRYERGKAEEQPQPPFKRSVVLVDDVAIAV